MGLTRLLQVDIKEASSSGIFIEEPLRIPNKDTTDVVLEVIPELLEKAKSHKEDYIATIDGKNKVDILTARVATFYLLSLQYFFEDGSQILFGHHNLFSRVEDMDAELERLKEHFGNSLGIAFYSGIASARVMPTDNGIVFECDERIYNILRDNIIGINSYVLEMLQYGGIERRGPPPTIIVREKQNLERVLS